MNARDINLDPSSRDDELAGLAEIRLLTVDGIDFRRVGVEALDGVVTLSGEVKTTSEKKQAEAVVGKVEGVCAVQNQLQVIRESPARSSAFAPRLRVRATPRPEQILDGSLGAEAHRQILENGSSELISKVEGVQ